MPRGLRACSSPGCPNLTDGGRCQPCRVRADQARGTARERYPASHERLFRRPVLRRDPLCVCTDDGHGHTGQCMTPTTVADHYPRSRRELVALGLDPDDPRHGRGLCKSCHDQHTAEAQPGGWHGDRSR